MGRYKLIETPEKMLEMFENYKTFVKSNPRYKHQLCQRTAEMVKEPLEVPLTMEGFEVYCFDKFKVTIDNYFRNENGNYDSYYTICTHIKKIIRQDQISGGMVGQYNPSITQRLNGLVEKSQVENDGKIEVIFRDGKTIL